MEVLGVTFAVFSLTIQLIDGVDRFQAFFEECRDPTISVRDLLYQLRAIQRLLHAVEREAEKSGTREESENGTSLEHELCRSNCKLQELTTLVTKFEAGSTPKSASRNSGKIRLPKNYFKLYVRQKEIRRYAEKLDRTRAIVLDHVHITLLEQVSSIHSRSSVQMPGPSKKTYYIKKDRNRDHPDAYWRDRQLVSSNDSMASTSTPHSDSHKTRPSPHAPAVINIYHENGRAMFNSGSKIDIKYIERTANVTMVKQSFKTKRPSQVDPDQGFTKGQHEDHQPRRPVNGRQPPQVHSNSAATTNITNTSKEDALYLNGVEKRILSVAGNIVGIEQSIDD